MKYDIVDIIDKKIEKHTKICFLTGIIVGILTHFYMLTHKLPNWDDLNNIASYGSGDFLGRWVLKYIYPIGGSYSVPAVHGMLYIVLLSVASCIILKILNTKTTTNAVLIPIIMLTFPTVASTMTFMFMAHTSGIGIVLSVLAVYFLRKYKWGMILSTVLLIVVLGIYQSYIAFSITLILLGLLVDLIDGKEFLYGIKHGVKAAIILIISVVVYMILSKIIYPNLQNETYGGVGSMGQIELSQVPTLIGRCYKRFLEFFIWKPFDFMNDTIQVCNIVICFIGITLFFGILYKMKIQKDWKRMALTILVAIFIPFGSAFIYFMAPDVSYSMLMLYPYALLYILVCKFTEFFIEDSINLHKIKKCIIAIACILVVVLSYQYYLITNQAYLRMDYAVERVGHYFNRIVSSVESQEEYENGDDVVFIGEFYYLDNPSPVELSLFDDYELRSFSGIALENGLITSGVRNNFIRHFVGFEMYNISEAEKEEIKNTDQYKTMSIYPKEGSIEKIKGIWIVKLCEE